MSKIKDTFGRAGTGIRKVGAGARTTALTAGTGAGATLLITGLLAGGAGSWIDGQRALDRQKEAAAVEAMVATQTAEQVKAAAVKEATRRAQRAERGMLEIDQLPQGVDRVAAAKAEADGKAFAFRGYVDGGTHGDIPCVAVLRMPSGTQLTFTMEPDATGFAGSFGPELSGISCGRLSGLPTPPRPPVTERPQLWDAAIRQGQAYVYDVPGNGRDGDGAPNFERPTYSAAGAVRVDVTRCTGFFIPKNLDRAGQPLEATAPMIAEQWSIYCWGGQPHALYP